MKVWVHTATLFLINIGLQPVKDLPFRVHPRRPSQSREWTRCELTPAPGRHRRPADSRATRKGKVL